MNKEDLDQLMDEESLEQIYSWVDGIPLSRPKKNISRDFSDGVLVAEIVKYHIPSLVEINNYPPANKKNKKEENWKFLNEKVFKKIGFQVGNDVIQAVTGSEPFSIEQFLVLLRRKIDEYTYQQKMKGAVTEKRNIKQRNSPVKQIDQGYISPGRGPGASHVKKGDSQNNLHRVGPGPTNYEPRKAGVRAGVTKGALRGGEMVPKIQVEEKEQEILQKEETIQILQAKTRRLEHLLHLKDLRIDDLQAEISALNKNLRPTNMRH